MKKTIFAALVVALAGWSLSPSLVHAATIAVNTTADEYDSGPNCSLREAIESANTDSSFGGCTSGSGDDIITVPAGTYLLSIFGGCESTDNSIGDLDITSNVTINGASASNTIIDAKGCDGEGLFSCDRVFDVSFGTSTIRSLTIRNGRPDACEGLEEGGGIRNAGSLNLDRVVVTLNEGANGGGIENFGFLGIVGSTISDNVAEGFCGGDCGGGDGGGINNTFLVQVPALELQPRLSVDIAGPTAMPIVNSTISGNMAREFGGGISSSTGSIGLRNVTITNNQSGVNSFFGSPTGGGVAVVNSSSTTTLEVARAAVTQGIFSRNTIIAGNIDNAVEGELAPDCLLQNDIMAIASDGFNFIGDNTNCGTGFVDGSNGDQVGSEAQPIDPLLGPLANNGGSTPTHALLTGSTAIDLANPAGCFADDGSTVALSTDQRGLTRPADGNADANVRCDIGAFEVQPLCGNGTVNAGEECDDGNVTSGDGCAADCTLEPACGDGTIDEGEQCDDHNTTSGDGCSADCTDEVVPGCGDGILQSGEECDGGEGCLTDCTLAPFCGDGTQDAGEECDDGNNVDDDGCSSTCSDESGLILGGMGCSLAPSSGASPRGFAGLAGIGMLVSAAALLIRKRIQG